jgi:hypothetical protein
MKTPNPNLGMIAFGKVKQLEKKIKELELSIEEIKEQIRNEDLQPIKEV